ncbi:MAG: transcription antitermination factor NusB [Dehalococcoidia bacterium]
MVRRRAREMALQGLYAAHVAGGKGDQIVKFVVSTAEDPPPEEARQYCKRLLVNTLDRLDWAKTVIAAKLENWDFDRVALIDQLIMELALVEMVYFDEVPLKVSISEAIEIAKRYSTDDSSGFVNGILDALYHDILNGRLTERSE